MTQVNSTEHLIIETTGQYTPEVVESPVSQEAVFDTLFDNYVTLADGPVQVPRRVGTDTYTKNPIFEYDNRDYIAGFRLNDLRVYARHAFIENGLSLDSTLLPSDGPIVLDDLVEAYVEDGVLKARLRAQAQGKLAAHVTTSEVDSDPETTHKFIEAIRNFAPMDTMRNLTESARRLIDSTVHYHSGEIKLNNTESIPTVELQEIIKK